MTVAGFSPESRCGARSVAPVVTAMIKRPPWTLPVIVFAQFAGTSIWFSGNAVLAELMQRWSSPSPMAGWITSAVQLGFIAGTLVFAIFAVSDRFSPRRVFLLCAVAGALSNLLTGLAGNSPGMAAGPSIHHRVLSGGYLPGGHEDRCRVVSKGPGQRPGISHRGAGCWARPFPIW